MPLMFRKNGPNGSYQVGRDTLVLGLEVGGPFKINSSISGWNVVNDVSGTSLTTGTTYQVYVFKPNLAAGETSATYTLSYTSTFAKNIYILAVGGGASGGGYWGGGGGAGGVVMATIPVPITPVSSTITVSVGSGGNVNASAPHSIKGSDTSVTFNNLPAYNIIASGGGLAGQVGNTGNAGGDGGSGGGGSGYQPTLYGNSNQPTYLFANVYGNRGGSSVSTQAGGGGGAGTVGGDGGAANTRGGAGGDGVKCSLPGIANFNNTYGNYYWGGGGGGCGWGNSIGGGNGGLGGGGGGGAESAYASLGGTGGINNGNPGPASSPGGDAGANTGGGGGGEWNQGAPGKGGSGIVIIAFPM